MQGFWNVKNIWRSYFSEWNTLGGHIIYHELINIINYKKIILALLIVTILIVIATQPPSGKRYYVAFSVRNNNEREITVRTTLAEPYQLFHVRPSDTFAINVAHDSAQPVFIQAVDRTTGTPITLNGKQSITLIPQDTPAVPQLYSAPNQCKLQLSLLLIHVYRIIAGEQERSQPKTRGGRGV